MTEVRKDRKKPETLRLRCVQPALTVDDVEASVRWYSDVLGFFVAERVERDGKLVAAGLKAGAVEIFLSQDDWAQGRDRKKGQGMRLYCRTAQDLDELAAKIKERGGVLAEEPTTRPWGGRDFVVVDPDGFKLSIAAL